jgi:hypothetical protein
VASRSGLGGVSGTAIYENGLELSLSPAKQKGTKLGDDKNMKKLKISGLLLGLFLGVTSSASASTVDYNVSFSGPGFSGSGDIAVDSMSNVVTGVTVNGVNVPVILPAGGLYTQPSTGLQWTYDDLFFKTGTPFDNAGLLLSFNNVIANVYSVGTQLYLSLSNPTADYNPGVPISLTVSQTPLPPGLPLFLTAIVGLWFLLGRKKKSSEAEVAMGHLGAA